MKAFIIFRDRVGYGRRCVMSMFAAGLEPVIVDHGSTWPEAVAWLKHLEKHDVRVLRRDGGHPRSLWSWAPFWEACGTEDRYVVTDPDVVPADSCPLTWPQHLGLVLDKYPTTKVGLGLRIDDIPLHYPRRDHVLSWEAQFWQRQIEPGVYDAAVDTTLALHRPLSEVGIHSIGGMRTGLPYVASHLAWYEDPAALPEEISYYHEHAEPGISYWTIGGRSAWGN